MAEQRTEVKDIAEYVTKAKWKRAGHVTRAKHNSWTMTHTEWQKTKGVRAAGCQKRRRRYDIVEKHGATLSRTAMDREFGGRLRRTTSCSGRAQPRRD